MTAHMKLYLSQYLGIEPVLLEDYGAFDVSVASDLPLFIDPFLPFHSDSRSIESSVRAFSSTWVSLSGALWNGRRWTLVTSLVYSTYTGGVCATGWW